MSQPVQKADPGTISTATGDSSYQCARGGCDDILAGPHEQPEHNQAKHLTLPNGVQNGMNEQPDIPRFGAGKGDGY